MTTPFIGQQAASPIAALVSRGVAGVGAGIAGGIVFGMMMTMMGMMPVIASLAGSSSPIVGWGIHLVISAAIGVGYGLVFGSAGTTVRSGWWLGIVYGAIWWVLGPLVIMPLMMGMGLQFAAALTVPMLLSLMGHMIYGVITGVVYPPIRQRLA